MQSLPPNGVVPANLMPSVVTKTPHRPASPATHRDPRPTPADLHRARIDQLGKGPLSFWFLNHQLEKPELQRQIHELKAKGFSGFFIHPRAGLLEPYGSSRWYELVGFCIEEARRCGMEAWLYDEDPFPSGAAGGRIIAENPSLAASSLKHRVLKIETPGTHTLDLEPGALVAAYLVRGNRIERIDRAAGMVRTRWKQSHREGSYYSAYREQGTPHWRAIAEGPRYRVVVTVDATPAWIVGFVRVSTNQPPWGAYPDPLNPKAVEAFIRYTHLQYAERFGESFGETVPGIFTDEAKLAGILPWSQTLEALYPKIAGAELMAILPHLVLDLDSRTPFFRWAFREALAQQFQNAFMKPVKEACQRCGLFLTGHMSPEEDPITQVLTIPGLMRSLAVMDIPGTDLIGGSIGDARQPLLHLSPKLASSAAHGAGKVQVACEAFAVTDWVQDLAFLSRVTNWLYALGVNRLVTHGQFYSIDGLRKREAPPSQFFQASYWEHFRAFTDSVAFLSEQLTQGTHEAPVLLYYPEESFMALSFPQEGGPAIDLPKARAMRRGLGDLVHQLMVNGYDFDLADADILSRVAFHRERLSLGEESFHTLVVPGLHLCESSWKTLQGLMAEGASVHFIESEIEILASTPYRVEVAGKGTDTLLKELGEQITPLWSGEGALIGHQRMTVDGPLLFLCNNGNEAFSGSVQLGFKGPYEVCDPTKGRQWHDAGNALVLEIPPGQAVLIRPCQRWAAPVYLPKSRWKSLPVDWAPWHATPRSENSLVLHQFRVVVCPVQRDRGALPSDGLFAGAPMVDLLSPACLDRELPSPESDRFLYTSFDWEGDRIPLRLVRDADLGFHDDALEEAPMDFFVNGLPVPPFTRRPTYDPMNREAAVTSLVRQGRNTLIWLQKGQATAHLPWPYDAVRLFGDFHMELPHGRLPPARLAPRPGSYRCGLPVSPVQLGHAHYGGMMDYHSQFTLSAIPARAALRFGHVYETMEVIINGSFAGCLWTAPYLLEVDPSLLRVGRNDIVLCCSTSPANYLQAMDRPGGTLGPIEWCIEGSPAFRKPLPA
ncbi:MAG TPA: glycosyl hydrolase [Chthoniobacteraceae bacterium]|nr:glycosyl hydrolase [Chthoniobacteraceae bacterium]